MRTGASTLDGSAVGLSLLCLIHCLALPVLAAFMPVAGVWAEAEWIHQILVLIAIPITALAALGHRQSAVGLSFIVPAVLGLALLLAAGFIEALHDFETPLTVIGATLLASAHIWRWANRNRQSV
ncbi:MAG: MerC domain-containing protein [Pseudomonadota bacterium]